MSETRQLMVPVKGITENLQAASMNLKEIGVSAREQFRRIEGMVSETGDVLHAQLTRLEDVSKSIADRVNSTADMVQNTVTRPVREVAAVAKGLGRGFEFLFRKNKKSGNSPASDNNSFV